MRSSTTSFRRLLRTPAIAIALCVGALAGCGDNGAPDVPSVPASDTYAASLGVKISEMTKKSDALYYKDLTVGTGAEAITGRTVQVTYTGWLTNGQQFDSNVGGNPYPVTLGAGGVIAGWEQGIVGMRVGGKRKLVIGSTLGYGSTGNGPIGPNQTLVFDVTLLAVQ